MRVERTPSLLTLGVVSSTDGLRIDTIAVGALDNYFVCSTNFGLQTTNGFTLPGEIRLCATPHKGFDRSSRKPTEECLCQLNGRVMQLFSGASWPLPGAMEEEERDPPRIADSGNDASDVRSVG